MTEKISAMKRILLTQLRVREFSEQSNFKDPCLSYMLRDVICSYCSTCRDIDLLRDHQLTQSPEDARWQCSNCSHVIDVVEIENRLVEAAEKLSVSFLLQDMRCKQTHKVSVKLCAATSDLCAPLEMDIPVSTLHSQLHVLFRVAEFYSMEWLKTTVMELMQM